MMSDTRSERSSCQEAPNDVSLVTYGRIVCDTIGSPGKLLSTSKRMDNFTCTNCRRFGSQTGTLVEGRKIKSMAAETKWTITVDPPIVTSATSHDPTGKSKDFNTWSNRWSHMAPSLSEKWMSSVAETVRSRRPRIARTAKFGGPQSEASIGAGPHPSPVNRGDARSPALMCARGEFLPWLE